MRWSRSPSGSPPRRWSRGNSGVFLRAWPEGVVNGADFDEIQILDDAAPQYAALNFNMKNGAVFKEIAPNAVPVAPAGAWNRLAVAMRGKHVQLTINGMRVVDGDLAKPKREMGRIGLQLYTGNVEFRHIRLRDPSKPVASDFTPLFNGKDLSGWSTAKGDLGNWKVVDAGAVTCTGVASYLYSTRDDYDDFHLRVEARVNDKGNSGVYFRAAKTTGLPDGFEAQINSTHSDANRTGTLINFVKIMEQLVPPDAVHPGGHRRGRDIRILVNGLQVVDYTDPVRKWTKGHIALQHLTETTKVEFRKVEIKAGKQRRTGPRSVLRLSRYS